MKSLQLPDGFEALETQVAGHTFNLEGGKFGLLVDSKSKCVFKPLGKLPNGMRELSFYESLGSLDPKYIDFKLLVPQFYKVVELDLYNKKQTFLKLENMTVTMNQPCVMDVKIGRQTWDPLATPKKRSMEEEKYSKCKQLLGFCIPGFQVYSLDSGELLRYEKDFGKQLHPENVQEVLETFFNFKKRPYPPLLLKTLAHLKNIEDCFKRQTALKFFASSILIAYDCEMLSSKDKCCTRHTSDEFDNQCQRISMDDVMDTSRWIKVKMIDFAHVFPNEEGSIDTNYLFGLQNLISLVNNMLLK